MDGQAIKKQSNTGKNPTNTWKILGKGFCYMILLLYPLRHIHWGLDLWDTGYNYANFQYMGLEHMDSMWLYSTYLANAMGNFFTKLPGGGTLLGMNFYTALFASGLAVAGFWFCTKRLHIPVWLSFVGEMLALSLCWCPTALLYNYLTYVLFLVCVMLLYLGLSRKNHWYLFGAGICLGTNVLVRFSNLPEMALIVGVWAYAVIEGMEAEGVRRRGMAAAKMRSSFQEETLGKRLGTVWKYAWNDIWRNTLWCLVGYLAALVALLTYIQIRYGLDDYVAGILRLFAMTDNATDYKATSMIMGLVGTYVENLYWVIRIGVFVVAGLLYFAWIYFCLEAKILEDLAKKYRGWSLFVRGGKVAAGVAWLGVGVILLIWLYHRGFCSLDFYSYGAILWPGVTFLMLTMGIAVIRIFHPSSPKEERLISGLLLLVVLLTSLGSNNKVYPSLNNLFVAAPYTLWECWRFFARVKEWRWKRLVVSAYPVKVILAAFLGMFLFQSIGFGANFVFVEATGARQVTATVDNNEVLKGVKMHPNRARWLEEITAYVKENDLQGREVILYGEIPALSFYLQMPSAYNPWSDLRSYSIEAMQEDMQETAAEMEAAAGKRPVIIVEDRYMQYLEKGVAALEAMELPQDQIQKFVDDKKWLLLLDFMGEHGYKETFANEKFTMFE